MVEETAYFKGVAKIQQPIDWIGQITTAWSKMRACEFNFHPPEKVSSRAMKEWHDMKTLSTTNILMTALLGGVIFSVQPANAGDGKFSLSDELNYRYGKYETGAWSFKLGAPSEMTPGTISPLSMIGHLKANGSQPALSDTEADATYNIYSGNASSFGIDLTGKIKLSFGDKFPDFNSLQNNYAAQADAYQSFDKFKAFGSLGYKMQENPVGISSDRLLYGSVGGAYQLNEQINGGIDFSLLQNPMTTNQEQRQISAYINHNISNKFKARGYILQDLSNTSNGNPDRSIGAAVYYGF